MRRSWSVLGGSLKFTKHATPNTRHARVTVTADHRKNPRATDPQGNSRHSIRRCASLAPSYRGSLRPSIARKKSTETNPSFSLSLTTGALRDIVRLIFNSGG